MKTVILLLALFVSSAAFADTKSLDPCAAFMPCGNFEGTGAWYDINNKKDDDGEYLEKIVISPVNETTVNLKVYIYRGELPKNPWADATIVFQPTGQFTFSEGDNTFGNGFCANKVCTLSFAPALIDDENPPFMNAFVNILRFDGDTLKRYNMVSDGMNDQQLSFQRSVLKRK